VSIADAGRLAAKKGLSAEHPHQELPPGAYVGRVRAGSAADRAGVMSGDVIVQLAGQTVRSDQDVHRVMANVRPGQITDLLFWRAGQMIEAKIRF
jgi:S1-C subfamily serine protease